MFCTGAAPTVPGIRARFSRPGEAGIEREFDELVPALAGAGLDDQGVGPLLDHAQAAHLDLEHDLRHVARQDDVAAAAENEFRRPAELGSSTTRRTSASLAMRTSVPATAGRPKVL